MRALIVVSLLIAAPLGAQLTETIEVSIVNLDVIVTDRQGNRVRGLEPSDFEVREDGKLQTITNFAEYSDLEPRVSSPAVPGAIPADEDTRAPRNPRTIVIFIERVRLLPWESDRLFHSLEQTVREVVRPGDAVALVFWNRAMTIMRDFTDDVGALTATIRDIREISKRVMLPDGESLEARQQEQNRLEQLLEGTDVLAPDTMMFDSISLARRALMQLRFKVYSIKSLINLMAPAQGRKILIMATRRFSEYAGAEFFPGATMPLDLRTEFDTWDVRKSLHDAANAAGVTVYTMFPPGNPNQPPISAANAGDLNTMNAQRDLDTSAFPLNILANEAGALDDLARSTGGLSAWGPANIAAMMPKVVNDLDNYYSLGYRATPGAKKREHRIEVRTVNREYRVRSRTSYVEKNENDRMADRVVAAIYRPDATNVLQIRAQLGEADKKRKKVSVPLKIQVPIAKLTTLPEGRHHAGAFTVFAAAGGRVGIVSDVSQKTQSFKIPTADLKRARSSHYSYQMTVVTDGGADYVAVGVLDEVSREFGIVRIPLQP